MSLAQGSQGKAVADLQKALVRRKLGIGGDRSGVFGAGTTSAVAEFQRRTGVQATGVVDQNTWRALGLPGSVPHSGPID
jgi:peptidoglycan hydrolase-like protein with peptidoglycan-binding domain